MRLKILEIQKHPFLGNLKLNFNEDGDIKNVNYTSLIIGSNGTGKSQILALIINIFREAIKFEKEGKRSGYVKGNFKLEYVINKNLVHISNYSFYKENGLKGRTLNVDTNKQAILIQINGEIEKNLLDYLPNKIIASTMIFADKFPAVLDSNFPQYVYAGIRNIKSPSTAGTKAINSRLVDLFKESKLNAKSMTYFSEFLNSLGYVSKLSILFKPKYRERFYSGGVTAEFIENSFNNWEKEFKRKSKPWGYNYFLSIKDDKELLKDITIFLNHVSRTIYPEKPYIHIDLFNDKEALKNLNLAQHLHKLDLCEYPTFNLYKNNIESQEISFEDSSSGEQNLIFSILGILGQIRDNSLILIDEPELSLHPNWQMKYSNILNKAIGHFNGAHLIIASHSHFIVSDLKGDSSKIVGLKRENKEIEVMELPQGLDTFGWSAEDVLYNVFNVRSSLNYYLQADLTELLGMIANNIKDSEKIGAILKKLNTLPKRENDPLQEIILEATEYYTSIQ